ncbi:ABC transporter permease [Salipiger aestuarii]|uniref:Peptide/nickel transport system permease protein n=1 Tax=Salipiger aestuarii TaxID=568098 RepID=A0A327YHT2_9RHOB|nr:ABC transporter permease [Salipiger aestuarii]EIE51528.1 opine ABC transporter, permease protein, putative [Citreicella sp. 357]KAA8608455.1 ABC transporter permease [Salipiger aestuarii]KAA8612268.1 ABC transporter permease [Salipiger aestuarii]KAB2541394.1 ABC transporter permease [Salipiger aestuarii]RAK20051.1 peptide/nickel transport system permease protein [Salipiger aestuarii]
MNDAPETGPPPRKVRSPGWHAIVIGASIMVVVILAALFAPLIAPHDPYAQSMLARFRPPSAEYWLGSDRFGRDTFSRILYGLRITLWTALASTVMAMVTGTAAGILSGYHGGRVDRWISAANDVLMSFPQMVAGIIIVALLGPGVTNLIIAIAITTFPAFYRMARSAALALRERDYIDACRVLGYSDLRIVSRHILPETMDDMIVIATLWLATAVRTESSLAFIGLGAPPPAATLGGLVREGFDNLLDFPGLAIWPSLAILVVMIGLNLMGDGLRDANDPRTSA